MQILGLESNNSRNGVQIWLSRKGKIFISSKAICNIRLKLKQNLTAKSKSLINVAEFKANFMGKLYYY